MARDKTDTSENKYWQGDHKYMSKKKEEITAKIIDVEDRDDSTHQYLVS